MSSYCERRRRLAENSVDSQPEGLKTNLGVVSEPAGVSTERSLCKVVILNAAQPDLWQRKKQDAARSLVPHMECFIYPCISHNLYGIPCTCSSLKEPTEMFGKGREIQKHLLGDWTSVFSVTFNAGQSDSF